MLGLNQPENWEETHKCCAPESSKKTPDYVVVSALEQFNRKLYLDLEKRKRAIKNWNKLKIILIVFKVFSGQVLANTIKH